MKTTTNQSEIEVITQQSTNVERNEASSETAEEDIVAEDPMLEGSTIKVDLEETTTTEIVTTFEASPEHTTTTEYPNEEISTEQDTALNEKETSTVTEDPEEATTENISSTEVQGTETAEKEEDSVFTTNKQSTEKPTTVNDETVEVTTTETELRDFSTEQAFADLSPTASNGEVLTDKSPPEQPNTSEPVDEQPETFTATPEETSTTTDSNSEELYITELSMTEVIPEETTTFDDMVREIPSEEEVFAQDSFDVETETTTMAVDEGAATETFTESSVAFEAKTSGTTTSVTNVNEGDLSTFEVEITTSATDFQTSPGQLNKQPKTVATPVGETTMIDVVTEKLLPEEVTETLDDSEGEINEDAATE